MCNENNNQDDYKKFYGKYRGKVIENEDPERQGRIIADVPSIPGSKTNYATPCVPYAGPKVGFLAIPPKKANVWIEFEGGDPTFPIWSGCFWGPDELPDEIIGPDKKTLPDKKIFKTDSITMILNDQKEEKGGFSLTCKKPAVKVELTMTFNSEGVTVKCPESEIKMTGENITLKVPKSEVSIGSKAIKITVPKSVIEITPQKIDTRVPSSGMSMTAQSIEMKTTDINATAGKGIAAKAPKANVTSSVSVKGTVNITGNTTMTGLVKMN
jgi:hypothetical protein